MDYYRSLLIESRYNLCSDVIVVICEFATFKCGNKYAALCPSKFIWCVCTVVGSRSCDNRVIIHYDGWNKNFTYSVPEDSYGIKNLEELNSDEVVCCGRDQWQALWETINAPCVGIMNESFRIQKKLRKQIPLKKIAKCICVTKNNHSEAIARLHAVDEFVKTIN